MHSNEENPPGVFVTNFLTLTCARAKLSTSAGAVLLGYRSTATHSRSLVHLLPHPLTCPIYPVQGIYSKRPTQSVPAQALNSKKAVANGKQRNLNPQRKCNRGKVLTKTLPVAKRPTLLVSAIPKRATYPLSRQLRQAERVKPNNHAEVGKNILLMLNS